MPIISLSVHESLKCHSHGFHKDNRHHFDTPHCTGKGQDIPNCAPYIHITVQWQISISMMALCAGRSWVVWGAGLPFASLQYPCSSESKNSWFAKLDWLHTLAWTCTWSMCCIKTPMFRGSFSISDICLQNMWHLSPGRLYIFICMPLLDCMYHTRMIRVLWATSEWHLSFQSSHRWHHSLTSWMLWTILSCQCDWTQKRHAMQAAPTVLLLTASPHDIL